MKKEMIVKTSMLLSLLALLLTGTRAEGREVTSMNSQWQFKKGTWMAWGVYPDLKIPSCDTIVNLPHTWNAEDFMSDAGYYRGEGSYKKDIDIPETLKGKRLFLRFEGAGQTAEVFVNWKRVAGHQGAYTAFAVEITDDVRYGEKNTITVTCDNAHRFDVAPQRGDFNVYGGLYRDVWLLTTEDVCITPLYYGSSGVLIRQTAVSEQRAEITAEIHLSSKTDYKGCTVEFTVLDANGNTVARKETPYIHNDQAVMNLAVEKPHLWNATEDPYLYRTVTVLKRNGQEMDRIEECIGFRTFYVDANKGFFLNGQHLKLHGVSRHQDWAGIASALIAEHHLTDLDMIQDMGANAIRMAHYPQAQLMMDESDRRGFVVWEEIPFVNYYINSPEFDKNLETQLREMIIQHYNHPSICFWGIYNEVNEGHDATVAHLSELAHQLDPYRLTTAATCFKIDANFITDLIGWNKYCGWYSGRFKTFERYFDNWHAQHPEAKTCISEYGAGGCINHHVAQFDEEDKRFWGTKGRFHSEEKQTAFHIAHIRMIDQRDWLWGAFIWNMFDFASSNRKEGEINNLNDKGLVTHDRKNKKDAYYLYRANWNRKEKTVHLCSKRYVHRKENVTDVKAFTTAPSAKLYINGKLVGASKADDYRTITWKDVRLADGKNLVVLKTAHGEDTCEWIVENEK
ncbi:MAG: glycoside hydrolase family 2 protein [Prevotella sp.]|nr:glycoside hydrolase family 2 protein [Prevotella sp.]